MESVNKKIIKTDQQLKLDRKKQDGAWIHLHHTAARCAQ